MINALFVDDTLSLNVQLKAPARSQLVRIDSGAVRPTAEERHSSRRPSCADPVAQLVGRSDARRCGGRCHSGAVGPRATTARSHWSAAARDGRSQSAAVLLRLLVGLRLGRRAVIDAVDLRFCRTNYTASLRMHQLCELCVKMSN